MSDRHPSLWDELRRALAHWMERDDDDDREQAGDPTLHYHLLFTAPLLIAVLMMLQPR